MQTAKLVALWLTLIGSIIGGIYGACFPVVSVMGSLDSVPSSSTRNLIGFASLILMFPAIVIGVYGGATIWLFVWRFFATRSDLQQVVFAGPTTKFDKWLFNRIVPSETSIHGNGHSGKPKD